MGSRKRVESFEHTISIDGVDHICRQVVTGTRTLTQQVEYRGRVKRDPKVYGSAGWVEMNLQVRQLLFELLRNI